MLSKIKMFGLALMGALLGLAPNANAAVTFDEATGFGGSLDLTFFYSAVPLVVTSIVAIIAVTLGIKLLRRAH